MSSVRWSAKFKKKLGSLSLDVNLEGGLAPIALIGPNGAGKTTLLKLILGASEADSGLLKIGEHLLFKATEKGQADVNVAASKRDIGYVPQGYGLFLHLNVVDNVAFGLTTRQKKQTLAREFRKNERLQEKPLSPQQAARKLLRELHAEHLAEHSVHHLSGGEKQRVALARALLVDPQWILLDEPMAALDATGKKEMRRFLREHLSQRLLPALLVTHDLRDVLALGADVAVLEHGKIVQQGTPQTLAADPASDFVEEFFSPLTNGSWSQPSSAEHFIRS